VDEVISTYATEQDLLRSFKIRCAVIGDEWDKNFTGRGYCEERE
jgi:hypothetical protein